MKKVLLSSIFAVALVGTVSYGVNKSMKSDANISDLALRNIEALAFTEVPGIGEPGGRYGVVYIFEIATEWKCVNGIAYQATLTDSDCYLEGNIICPGTQMSVEEIGYCV